MKFNVNVSDLKQTTNEVAKSIVGNKNIEIFGGILITTNNDFITLTATDGTMRVEKNVKAEIIEQGTELVKAELFSSIINQLNNDDILNISSQNQTLHIKT